MKILSVNAGSSSLKFTLLELPEEKVIISGTFEKIGIEGSFYTIKYNGNKDRKEVRLENHTDAVKILLDELINYKVIKKYEEIDGIGHRLVHGGDKYTESVLIDEDVLNTVEKLVPLAPLHNPANLVGVRSFMEVLPNTPMVAVFDTAFHQTMKEEEFLYAVPREWYERYGVRRYGFHGTSHRFIANKMREILGEDKKIISCHIGNGASICAIKDGKSIATSMGFTPIAGVIMGTRCGDIDVGLIPYVMSQTKKKFDDVMTDLNKNSGMLGLTGVSSDMRDVEEGYNNKDPKCITAMNMYADKIVDYISMYDAKLEGAEYIVFTAGVGENSDVVREMVCKRLAYRGIKLDEEKNKTRGINGIISTDDSSVKVCVLSTDEELMIAKDTYDLINK